MTALPPASRTRIAACVLALAIGGPLLLLSVSGAIPAVAQHFTANWNGEAGISTPRIPFVGLQSDIEKDDPDSMFSGVLISSPDPLPVPRLLMAIESGLAALIAIAACLIVVTLAIRLLTQRSFGPVARWGLIALGGLMILSATLGPQLGVLSVDLAVQELGYPIFDPAVDLMMTDDSPEKVVLGLWDPVWVVARFDFTGLVLGAALLLLGSLIRDGIRLQRETESLV